MAMMGLSSPSWSTARSSNQSKKRAYNPDRRRSPSHRPRPFWHREGWVSDFLWHR